MRIAFARERILGWAALGAVLALAAGLRFSNLAAIGYGNHYYTAAVESMLQSWPNFFFVAAEPGGSVSVDKPPVGLWLQAVSAFFLGVNGFAVVLPQIIAGLLSIAVLYHLVRRSFGTAAGLLAALALAVTPVVVATDRNNTIDSTLILTLLLAAWAFILATERGRLRFLLLGATLVGLGFNIKMLQAFLPLPAFYALYLLGAAQPVWRKLANLALASLLLVGVSLSWALAVDLTPANQRPYVGSSGDNSVLSLALGYNGLQRLLGRVGRDGAPGQAGGFPQPSNGEGVQPFPQPPGGLNNRAPQGLPPRNPGQPGAYGGLQPPAGPSDGPPPIGPPGRPNAAPGRQLTGPGPGGMDLGQPGPLRLFVSPLSKEMSWLLPFGLLSILLLAFSQRPGWPLAPGHRALVLWGGWLLTCLVFFSLAGFFHEYYLSMLAPPLAALTGAGAGQLWGLRERRPRLAFGLLLCGAGVTLVFQVYTALSFTGNAGWLLLAGVIFLLAIVLLGLGVVARTPRLTAAAFICLAGAMLVIPTLWSGLTTAYSANQALPQAYGGQVDGRLPQGPGGMVPGDQAGLRVDQKMLDYLQQNTQGMQYLLAVPSSMLGSDYILATGRPVLLMGGFNGQDPVVTAQDLSALVAAGQLRYVLWGGMGASPGINAWVTGQCKMVSGLSNPTPNRPPQGGLNQPAGPGGAGVLYDCAPSRK